MGSRDDGIFGGNILWIIIIIVFLMCFCNRGGYGGYGGGFGGCC